MSKYNLSKNSEAKLSTCNIDIQKVIRKAIQITRVDFGVSEGHRPAEKQLEKFSKGRRKTTNSIWVIINEKEVITYKDGYDKKGEHNYQPSRAIDLYGYVNGKTDYTERTMSYLAGLIVGVSEMMYQTGEITHKLKWGGNWNMDGEIITDQNFDDLPHIQIV